MPPRAGRREIDMVHADAEVGDELQARAGGGDQRGIDPVGDCRHEDVRIRDRGREPGGIERRVPVAQRYLEQFAHSRFDRRRKPVGYDDPGVARAIHAPIAMARRQRSR